MATTDPAPADNPQGNPDTAAILAKYQALGKDHPTVIKLQEACIRGQKDVIQQLTQQLDELLAKKPTEVKPAPSPAKRGWLLWSLLWCVLLTAGLLGAAGVYLNTQAQAIIARNPIIQRTGRIELSKLLGGPSADQLTETMIAEIEGIHPDNLLFIGSSLYKVELVKYLSDKTHEGNNVVLVFGKGSPLLGKEATLLRNYAFSYVYEAQMPFNTYNLVAWNTKTGKAVAFFGTFPFDRTSAESTENILGEVSDPAECNKLIVAFNTHILNRCRIVSQQPHK